MIVLLVLGGGVYHAAIAYPEESLVVIIATAVIGVEVIGNLIVRR
jgi:hypothetical protein